MTKENEAPDAGGEVNREEAAAALASLMAQAGYPLPGTGMQIGGVGGQRRTMAFVCSKGNLDMAYPALIMANAALGEGHKVHLFFTFWGIDLITKKTMDKLKFTMVGNTAMHMPLLDRVRRGWGKRSIPHQLGIFPGATAFSTWYMHRQLERIGVPSVREMLDQIEASGGHIWACRLSTDMMDRPLKSLHRSVEGILDATEFVELSEGAQIIFV